MAELLLANGTDVHARAGVFGTLLHWAARTGQEDVAKLPLAEGADVNAKDQSGATSLRLAALYNRSKIVDLLKQHGAKE